ncbi:MAG: PEP-CTERM sorting domain-containing protein [Rhodoferax sp.]|nr:PEP-CTERM sorting domain-containing protein [Rhodoferax sp.]
MAASRTLGLLAGHHTIILALALVVLGHAAPAWSGTVTSTAALDFSLTFTSTGIGVSQSESVTPFQTQANDAKVTITNVPGSWSLRTKDDSYVYSLTGLMTKVQVTDQFPTSAWGDETWAAFLQLTNVSGTPVNLSVTASWKPNLTLVASGFSPDDQLQPYAVSRYYISSYLIAGPNDPVGDTPPGWDGNKEKSISLGDPAFSLGGSDTFSVPLGESATKSLWLRIQTRAGAEIAEAPEPGTILLVLGGIIAIVSTRKRIVALQ